MCLVLNWEYIYIYIYFLYPWFGLPAKDIWLYQGKKWKFTRSFPLHQVVKVILFILNGLHLQQKLSHSQTISLGVLSSLIKDSVCSGVQQGLDLDNLNNLCKVRKANNKIFFN